MHEYEDHPLGPRSKVWHLGSQRITWPCRSESLLLGQ